MSDFTYAAMWVVVVVGVLFAVGVTVAIFRSNARFYAKRRREPKT
jgi:hypothetical protein